MTVSKIALSLALISLGLSLIPQNAEAKFEGYSYFETQGIGQFGIFPDQRRYKLGETMNLKYGIRSSEKDLSGVKMEIYRVSGVLADNNYSANANDTNDYTGKITLLKTVEFPVVPKAQYHFGETSIALNSTNGFEISRIDPSQPLTYSVNRDTRNFILVKIHDPNKTIVNYDNLGWKESQFNRSLVFFIDNPTSNYPDLTIEGVSLSKNALQNTHETFSITYQVKNIGAVASTENTEVCFKKRNIIVDRIHYILDVYDLHNKMICDTIGPIAPNAVERHTINYDPSRNNFGTQFSDTVGLNDQLTVGNNRLALVLNPYSYLAESSYDNNEYIVNLNVGGTQPTAPTNPTTPTTQTTPQPVNFVYTNGMVLKSPSHTAVYYYENGTRRPFINAAVYYTWFANFSNIKTITVTQMEAIPLGIPMPIKAGTKLLKFPLNPRVYEIVEGNKITHIKDEAAAIQKFGRSWAGSVIELPEIYYLFYQEIK